jgi:radical SAM superfamily enzyme YgiQ (UPF0313 family)
MKLLFLYHPKNYLVHPDAQVGLGLLLIATIAKKCGHEVTIENLQSGSLSAVVNTIDKSSTDFILLSGTLADIKCINAILTHYPDRHFIIGGPIAASYSQLVPFSGYAISGPGEQVPSLLRSFKDELAYNTGSQLIEFKWDSLSLENYPFPDRKLLPQGKRGGNIWGSKTTAIPEVETTTLLTSRGCKSSCAFCSSGSCDFTHYYDMSEVEKEVVECVKIGIRSFRVSDDNLISDKSRLYHFCSIMQKYECQWRASIMTHPNELEMYQIMKEAGCLEVSFGVESADPYILHVLKKPATVNNNTNAIINSMKAGLSTRALMMTATPGQTPISMKLNREWLSQFKGYPLLVPTTIFLPFPGTEIYNSPSKFGIQIHESSDQNIYMFRGDGSIPESHISILGGLTRDELTQEALTMKNWLEENNFANLG